MRLCREWIYTRGFVAKMKLSAVVEKVFHSLVEAE